MEMVPASVIQMVSALVTQTASDSLRALGSE
jgi:hypothetical protein